MIIIFEMLEKEVFDIDFMIKVKVIDKGNIVLSGIVMVLIIVVDGND